MSRTSPTSSSIRKGPPILSAEKDETLAGVAAFLSDPRRPIESTLATMMKTVHLAKAGPHPVIASAAGSA